LSYGPERYPSNIEQTVVSWRSSADAHSHIRQTSKNLTAPTADWQVIFTRSERRGCRFVPQTMPVTSPAAGRFTKVRFLRNKSRHAADTLSRRLASPFIAECTQPAEQQHTLIYLNISAHSQVASRSEHFRPEWVSRGCECRIAPLRRPMSEVRHLAAMPPAAPSRTGNRRGSLPRRADGFPAQSRASAAHPVCG